MLRLCFSVIIVPKKKQTLAFLLGYQVHYRLVTRGQSWDDAARGRRCGG